MVLRLRVENFDIHHHIFCHSPFVSEWLWFMSSEFFGHEAYVLQSGFGESGNLG